MIDLTLAAEALARDGLAHLPGLLSRSDVDDAQRFALAHDFEEAWRHSAGGRAIEAALSSAADTLVGPHHLAPHRFEKVSGYREDSRGLHLYAWHRDPPPRRASLLEDQEVGAWLAAVLFADLGARAPTLEVLAGSAGDAVPQLTRRRQRLEGRRGDVWILPARAWRRYTAHESAALVLDPLLPRLPAQVTALERRIQRRWPALAERANLAGWAARVLGAPSALDVALTVCVARRTARAS